MGLGGRGSDEERQAEWGGEGWDGIGRDWMGWVRMRRDWMGWDATGWLGIDLNGWWSRVSCCEAECLP